VLLVFRTYAASWVRTRVLDCWRSLAAMLARSAYLILHPMVMMTAMLSAQSMVRGQYALEGLGAYNAAMTILDTALMVIMASARSFVLPSLGQIEDPEDRARVVNRVLRLNLILASAATLVTTAGAPLLIPLLFSGRFEQAIEILPPFSLALVGQAFVWSYLVSYLQHARYRLFFALDLVWALVYVGATALAVGRPAPLAAAAWAYSGSYWVSGILYTVVAVRVFGARMLERASLRLGSLALLGTLAACLVQRLGSWRLDVAVLCVALAALGWALRASSQDKAAAS
jgi:Polysaccharide biosynthesis protein